MLALFAAAQSRDKAKKLFNSGKFEEAKPMFQKQSSALWCQSVELSFPSIQISTMTHWAKALC